MEPIQEANNTKQKMAPNTDSSSKHVQQSQAEEHDMDPNVEQNLMDPNLRTMSRNQPSAKRSRKKKVNLVKILEDRAKSLEDQLAQLQPQLECRQKQVRLLIEEEQALRQEIEYLEKKALLRDAEDEKKRSRINRLRELRDQKQEQLRSYQGDGSGSKS